MLSLPATMARCKPDKRVSAIMVSTTCSRPLTERGCTMCFSLKYPRRRSGHTLCVGHPREIGEGGLAAHIELDFAHQLDDGFRMAAVLEQRVFDGLGAVDEQA